MTRQRRREARELASRLETLLILNDDIPRDAVVEMLQVAHQANRSLRIYGSPDPDDNEPLEELRPVQPDEGTYGVVDLGGFFGAAQPTKKQLFQSTDGQFLYLEEAVQVAPRGLDGIIDWPRTITEFRRRFT